MELTPEELHDWMEEHRETHALKLKVSELKRKNKLAMRSLELADKRLEVALALGEDHHEPEPIRPRTRKQREATPVVVASDWHIEEVVNPDAVTSRNKYGLKVSKKRAANFFDGVAWLVKHHRTAFEINDLVLGLLGDMISGYIHEELVETNECSPTEATLYCQEYIEAGINHLLDDLKLERIVIPCNFGNHGRTTTRRRFKTGWQNSYEWLMYNHLARLFRDDARVDFRVSKGSHLYTNVYGLLIRTLHGDDCTYRGGIGGLSIPVLRACAKWDRNRKADITLMGHFHQLLDLGHVVVNGSLIGDSEYGDAFGLSGDPAQAFFLIDKKRGKCQSTPVWVT